MQVFGNRKNITTHIQKELFEIKRNRPDYKEKVKASNEKRENTNLKKRGVKHPLQCEECQNKYKQTCKENNGVENPMFSKDIKETLIQTFIKNLNTTNPMKNPFVKMKSKKTLNEKGVDNVSQLPEVKEKKRQTFMEHFNTDCNFKDKECRNSNLKIYRRNHWSYFINALNQKSIEPLFEKDDYIEQNEKSHHFHCRICDKDFVMEEKNTYPQKIFCSSLSHNNKSYAENEVFEWLKSIGIENIERNKRKWHKEIIYEADIFLPNYNIAIEYNGLYWHSNINKENNYHYDKWKFFKDMNIRCIQIFENEWRDKQEIVKNIILDKLNLLQKFEEKDYRLDTVNDEEFDTFIEQNSLFNLKESDYKLGIYSNSNKELIQVLSYSISDDRITINNFCTKLGYRFKEGLKAFIQYFKQTYNKNIYIEIDCRYFDRNDFEDLEFVEHTEPKCYYFKNKENILFENKIDEEYFEIYDCGNDILMINIHS